MVSSENIRRRTGQALSTMYDLTSTVAASNEDSTMGVAAGTAASFLSIGIDKVNRKLSEKETMLAVDRELDGFGEAGEPREHFVDKLLDKLLLHALPKDLPGREDVASRLSDPDRKLTPRLSLTTLTGNFKNLSSRMSGLFEVQYALGRVFMWRHPSVTISVLFLYTAACLYPHLLLIYPLVYLLFGVMLPAYEHRHPIPRAETVPTKRRGQSLMEFLNQTREKSIAEELIAKSDFLTPLNNEGEKRSVKSDERSMKSDENPRDGTLKAEIPADDDEKPSHGTLVKSQMELFINMRDLQNLTTDVIKVYDATEEFVYGTAGFKDERISTSLFISVLLLIALLVFLGPYTPWRLIFVSLGWAVVVVCHPKCAKYVKRINHLYIAPRNKKMAEFVASVYRRSERNAIILDEQPEVREVEVFELEQGLTASQWNPYCFAVNSFERSHAARLTQRRPVGATHLSEVLPPKGWKFDAGEDHEWQIDYNANKYVRERGITGVRIDDQNEWVYDVEGGYYDSQWRRRRWVRSCYRYARAPKRSHTLAV
ncbi:hypothetical protein BABINDRAFT_57186 [Babjeviella inositovora NRRL Y-12698]|uniref:TECPR1-like DysF domain-containing protein n=1 Tax=Babjeviella inositovora NRRL Y-12698 TaxID=984486 RepID=A0A1E3QZN0_9ASCO|nr:uncharacterized protein BABINDRAFT_57186 [Babjeviella inositovora NRRL Y-12698]ODQ83004.1 hypothetical protein BABINDRAFT_57186 [Babjeviella inositovora NRRL Y-12698]